MKKKVGTVSEEDKNNIIDICEKKVALDNLEKVSLEKIVLEKMVEEQEQTKKEYDNWWSNIGQKYQFEGDENGHWEIDFQSGVVTLVT